MSKELSDEEVQENWVRRDDVKQELGKSLSAIGRLTNQGKLKSRRINGILYYDPKSVEEVKLDPDVTLGTNGEQSESLALARMSLDLLKGPRTDIDALQFKMLEYQSGEIQKLLAENAKLRAEINQARDTNVEREMAVMMAKTDADVKKLAGMRMVETLSKLALGWKRNGDNGVTLTPKQLEDLLAVTADGGEAFLDAKQTEEAKRIIEEAKKKVDAGKAATQEVAKQTEAVAQ